MRMPRNDSPVAIFGGRSNPALAQRIAEAYGTTLGEVTIRDFADGEIYVRFEESIRGADLFIIQSTHPRADNWMELLLLIDAAKRASAARVTAVIPYFGYARQERKDQPRVSIAAKLMANMLTTAGVDRILTMELHAPQIQGFFDVPVDHLYGSGVLIDHIKAFDLENVIVVAPDVGGIKMARAYAQRLGVNLALIDKRRPQQNEARVMNIIGDVEGKNVVIIDDIVDTAGTITRAAQALKDEGALNILAACTHPLLSGPAYDRIEASPIERLMVTDTVPLKRPSDCIEVVSVSGLFAKAIRHIYTDRSVSTLFKD
jgi:ribose-phosphate pyrophosphokinase